MPATLIFAGGLLVYTTVQAIRTRQRQYLAWSAANVMLAVASLTQLPVFHALFIAGIVLTIFFQWQDRRATRPMSVDDFLRQAQDESIRRARRDGKP